MHFNPADNQKSLDFSFNKNHVASCTSVKHLGMLLNSRLNFNEHVQSKTNKCCKIGELIKKFSIHLPREALLKIYKTFVTMATAFLIKVIMNHSKKN